jgi:Phosphotransferase system mannitol/fructose-specific IIA domain (Ntr-type)
MTISEILHATDVNLALRAGTKVGAVDEVLAQLHGDPRVKDWAALREAIIARDAPALVEGGAGICIAHGRTPAVGELVFAAGRSRDGILCPEVGTGIRLFFVAGIPSAVDSEYLRLVGAIARACRDPREIDRLLEAQDGDAFVEILVEAADRLD